MKFNEDSRVKIPAILHLIRLGYTYLSLKGLSWDESSNIVPAIFHQSIAALNPSATPVEIQSVLSQLLMPRKALAGQWMSPSSHARRGLFGYVASITLISRSTPHSGINRRISDGWHSPCVVHSLLKDHHMLKARENVPAPAPEPLSPAAVSLLFQRIRMDLHLQPAPTDAPQAHLTRLVAQRADRHSQLQAAGFPFASDADYSAI